MKAATIFRLTRSLLFILFLVSFLGLTPQQAQAQDSGYLEPSGKYSREELAQLLAPIALYPDALLSQVLMASTYPIEVIEADRWVRINPELKDEALDAYLLDKNWDPSVKALCHFPSILALMSERITETTNLGNAFLAQEAEVMDMVQALRAAAYAQGNLATTSRQQVIVEKETIIIEPADPRVIYVPYYDPFYVYGPWWYPAYPPYYWGPAGVTLGFGISYWPGFYFGFAFGSWSYFDWHHHYIHIDVHKRPRFVRHDRWLTKPGPWQHAPSHRRGVAYRDKSTARKYGQAPPRFREIGRDTRGFPGYRQQDPNRRGDDRTVIDRNKRGDDRTRIDRDRQEQQRQRVERDRQQQQQLERTRKEREQAERNRQGQQRVERDRQQRQQLERTRKEREQAERNRQGQQRFERDRQQQQQLERTRKEREQAERNRQGQQRVERDRQQQQQLERARKEREQAERNRQGQQRVERDRQQQQQFERTRKEREQAERNRQGQQRVERDRQQQQRVEREHQERIRDNIFNQVENGRRERQSSERGRASREERGNSSRDQGRSGGSSQGGRDDRGRYGR